MATEVEPNLLLLQPYVALDVLCRGKGSSGIITILGQHLIISEQLCRAGFEPAQLGPIRQGHAALVRIDGQAKEDGRAGFEPAQLGPIRQGHAALVRIDGQAKEDGSWIAAGNDYEALRDALQVYDRQLTNAPATEIRMAHTAMSEMLNSRRQKLAEQQATSAR